jgi:cell division protein FtsQ
VSAGTDLGTEAAGGIDPRIRARRIAVRRDEGRRRLRRLAAAAAVVVALVLGWALTRTPLLDVDAIVVAGTTRTPAEVVAGATGVVRGDAMSDLDLAAAERSVEALPWVATATVQRDWPGTLRVRITERSPVAAVPGPGPWAVVDGAGRVLDVAAEPPAVLPRVSGVAPAGPAGTTVPAGAADVLDALRALPAGLADRVRGVDVAADGMRLAVGPAPAEDGTVGPAEITVVLGPAHDVAAKAVSALAVLARVDVGPGAVLDVRVPSAPALTRAR